MADLGDIGNFLKDGNVSDLSWLDVPEDEYKAVETLPKQNLDVGPDLEALWDREDTSSSRLVPNRAAVPKTMGDLSEAHGFLRANPEEIRKVARLALMQSDDFGRFRDALQKRFDGSSIRAAREVVREVLAERGLLGRYYIDASDFPACSTGAKGPAEFVRRFAAEAPFVRAKMACAGCTQAKGNLAGGCNCAVFHKQIEVAVPYTDALADVVEKAQEAKGVKVASSGSPKERIQLALLGKAPRVAQGFTGQPQAAPRIVATAGALEAAVEQAKDQAETEQEKVAAQKARPVIALLRREMLKGRNEDELLYTLKLAFQPVVLSETASRWEPLLKQAGAYGAVYITQDSFGDCHEGSDFISKHNSNVRSIVRGSKCVSCIYAKVGRCMIYGKRLVASIAEVLTDEMVSAVLHDHKFAGRIAPWDNREWGTTPLEALRNIHKVATSQNTLQAAPRMDVLTAFRGESQGYKPNTITQRNIVKAAREYMNEGLYGSELLTVLKSSFEVRDLKAAATALKPVLAEQGLQGVYFVDPTVYDDYGKGCDRAASLHRTRGVPYAKVGEKCGSCVLQTNNFCSKLHKPLVLDPPYTNKVVQQREILATGKSTEVRFADLVNNGHSMMAEYEIQHREIPVEIDPVIEVKPLNISFR